MSYRALYSSDVSNEHIADALHALATDVRSGDAHLTGYNTATDVTVEEAVEWNLSVGFILTADSEYKRVTDPYEVENCSDSSPASNNSRPRTEEVDK